MNKEFLKNIKPQVTGKSDKYSWGIYKYLMQLDREGKIEDCKVMWYRRSQWDSRIITEFEERKDHILNHIFLLTNHGGLIGVNCGRVMQGKTENFFYEAFGPDNFKDITEWFEKEYTIKGRCLFDEQHDTWFIGAENRYSIQDENKKVCTWCGCTLEKKVEYVPHEKFVPVPV